MVNINDEIDHGIDDLDEDERREAYLQFFRSNFPFLLCPALAKRSSDLPNLAWTRIKYKDHSSHTFPSQQGVYIFTVDFEHPYLPNNSYVMYVGKAGDTNSMNTIADRFTDYVNPSGYRNRPRVKKMVKHFSDHLFYHYATIPNGSSTANVEEALADIFVPPCCQKDFSATARNLLRGARII